jgi:hypothetical protein
MTSVYAVNLWREEIEERRKGLREFGEGQANKEPFCFGQDEGLKINESSRPDVVFFDKLFWCSPFESS